MKLTEEVYLVGSGMEGSGLTDEYDCNLKRLTFIYFIGIKISKLKLRLK